MAAMESKSIESNISKSLKRKRCSDETFDFPPLPYVCQRRFAEICDPRTFKCFSSINQNARNLVKRCHIIEKIEIVCRGINSPTNYKFSLSCFCKENEYCKDIIINENLHHLIFSPSKRVMKIIIFPYYRQFERLIHRRILKKLRIFTDETRKFVYDYNLDNKQKIYRCRNCHVCGKHTFAKMTRNHEGEEYIQMSQYNQHVCEPIPYLHE